MYNSKCNILVSGAYEYEFIKLKKLLNSYAEVYVMNNLIDSGKVMKYIAEHKINIIILYSHKILPETLKIMKCLKIHKLSIKILVISSIVNPTEIANLLLSGIDGYCLETSLNKTLIIALNEIINNCAWVDPQIQKQFIKFLPNINYTEHAVNDLTQRETEVLRLMVNGKSNGEIAELLMISTHTAKAHVCNILQKLNVTDRVQAAVKAVKDQLV